MTSGIKRSINASANAPTRGSSGRAVRRARRTSTGFERAPLRRADASSPFAKFARTARVLLRPRCGMALRTDDPRHGARALLMALRTQARERRNKSSGAPLLRPTVAHSAPALARRPSDLPRVRSPLHAGLSRSTVRQARAEGPYLHSPEGGVLMLNGRAARVH